MNDWRYELLGLVADQKWHSYWDIISLGVTMGYWNEEKFRNCLNRALEYNLIKAKGVNTDLRDLEFAITSKGDGLYIQTRSRLIGTKWHETHMEQLKYHKNLAEKSKENEEYLKWRTKHGNVTNKLVTRQF